MIKQANAIIAGFAVLCLLAAPAMAVDFGTTGEFRLRPQLYTNLDLQDREDLTNSVNTNSFWDFRLRLDPTAQVTDNISLHSQIDFLGNFVGGGNSAGAGIIGAGVPTTQSVGGLISPLPAPTNTNDVEFRRVWAQINTSYGNWRLGRMGYHWGLGFIHNDGNGLNADFGETVDAIELDFALELDDLGTLHIIPSFHKLVEASGNPRTATGPFFPTTGLPNGGTGGAGGNGNLFLAGLFNSNNADSSRYNLALVLDTEDTGKTGVLFSYIDQKSIGNTLFFGPGPVGSDSIEAFQLDIFADHTFDLDDATLRVAAEGVITGGSVGGFYTASGNHESINAYGLVAEIDLQIADLGAHLHGGWVPQGNRIQNGLGGFGGTAADYTIAHLLFNQPLGDFYAGTGANAGTGIALGNVYYIKPGVDYQLTDEFNAAVDVLFAWAENEGLTDSATAFGIGGDSFYGVELDTTLTYQPHDNLIIQGLAGVLLPGDAFDIPVAFAPVDGDAEIAYTFSGNVVVPF